jgi:RHS repeat-associated protein
MQNARQPYLTDSDIMELHYGPQDHLGSTRAVIQREGASVKVVEAMMYQAYGKMVPLAVQTDPVRMTFTTKEFDNESGMGLYYFGARYLDPEIGSWASTDRMHQFYSPYAYASNGRDGSTNPIEFIDYDGNWGPIEHTIFSGGDVGVALVDNYRNRQNTEKGRNGEAYAHEFVNSPATFNALMVMKNPRLDLFTNHEWRDIQEHVFQDYYHHFETKALSPIQRRFKDKEKLKKYQDEGSGLLLSPFALVWVIDMIWAKVVYNREYNSLWLSYHQISKIEKTIPQYVSGHKRIQNPTITTTERISEQEIPFNYRGVDLSNEKK